MHQLSSAAVLAADLARHPNGARLADVVDRVLALSPAELGELSGPAPSGVRLRVRGRCPDRPVSHALEGLRDGLFESTADRVLVLEAALMGTLEDLLDLLAGETPLATASAEARQVALDAVVATWAGSHAAPSDVALLLAPWEAGLDPVPPALPVTPWAVEVRDLLEEVLVRTPEQWRRTVRGHREVRQERRWSEAMHIACTAAYRHDRLHDVARTQVAAARALALTHTGVAPMAAALSVTAAVQGVCTADIVPADITRTLRRAWDAGT